MKEDGVMLSCTNVPCQNESLPAFGIVAILKHWTTLHVAGASCMYYKKSSTAKYHEGEKIFKKDSAAVCLWQCHETTC